MKTLAVLTRSLAAMAAVTASATLALAQPPLEALPSILQLQLSQHPAWRAYKDAAAQSKADSAHAASHAALLNAMTTPQRLAALRIEMQQRQQSFERQAAATQAFYAELSPEQKHVFDEVTRVPSPPPYPPQRRPPQGLDSRLSQGALAQGVLKAPPSDEALVTPSPGGVW